MRRMALATCASVFAVAALSACIATAQQPQQTKSPQFEVASIKPGKPQPGFDSRSSGGGLGGQYRMENVPLRQWVKMALTVNDYALQAPPWLDSTRFDLIAKLPADKPVDQNAMAGMMKSLLIERFGLKWHEEAGTVSGFELVTDKKVLLTPATLLERLGHGGRSWGPTAISGTNMSMPELAEMLSDALGKKVVDATHISGGFDIKLMWRPLDDAKAEEEKRNGIDVDNLPSTVFTAVREKLGLRLQSAMVPSKIIVVDNINRQPTGN